MMILFYWSIVDLQCCITFCCTESCVCVCVCVCIFSIVQLFYEVIRKHCSGRAGREHLRTHGWAGNKHHGPVISQDPDGGSVQEQLRWLPHTVESNWGGSPHTIEVCRSSWGGSLTPLRAVEVDHLTIEVAGLNVFSAACRRRQWTNFCDSWVGSEETLRLSSRSSEFCLMKWML